MCFVELILFKPSPHFSCDVLGQFVNWRVEVSLKWFSTSYRNVLLIRWFGVFHKQWDIIDYKISSLFSPTIESPWIIQCYAIFWTQRQDRVYSCKTSWMSFPAHWTSQNQCCCYTGKSQVFLAELQACFFTIETVLLSFIRFLFCHVGFPGCLFIEFQCLCVYIWAWAKSRSEWPSNQVFNYVLCYLLILIFFEFQTMLLMLMISETLWLTVMMIRFTTTFLFSQIAFNCVSYLGLLLFTNITRFISDFRNFFLLDFYLNPPVSFWPVGRQWFFFPILSDKSHVLTAQLYNPLFFYLHVSSQSVGDVLESISPSGTDKQKKVFLGHIRQHIRLHNVFSIFQVKYHALCVVLFLIISSVWFCVAFTRWQVPIALLSMARSFSVEKLFNYVQLMFCHWLLRQIDFMDVLCGSRSFVSILSLIRVFSDLNSFHILISVLPFYLAQNLKTS